MARGISVVALVLSIFVPLVGLIVGIIAFRHERRDGGSGTLPIVAIIIGLIGTIVWTFIIVIAGIAAFGVFDPAQFAQERCLGDSTRFACTSNAVAVDPSSDTVSFELVNGAGERVTITRVSAGGSDCSPVRGATFDADPLPVTYEPNERFVVRISCPDIREGVFEEAFTVTYDVIGGASGVTSRVEVVAMV